MWKRESSMERIYLAAKGVRPDGKTLLDIINDELTKAYEHGYADCRTVTEQTSAPTPTPGPATDFSQAKGCPNCESLSGTHFQWCPFYYPPTTESA